MNMQWADRRWPEQNFNPRKLDGMQATYHPQVKFAGLPTVQNQLRGS